MKHWLVSFATIQNNTVVEEAEIIIEAITIGVALQKAYKEIRNMVLDDYQFTIWNIGIIEDDIL
jgi:hypothetical protein